MRKIMIVFLLFFLIIPVRLSATENNEEVSQIFAYDDGLQTNKIVEVVFSATNKKYSVIEAEDGLGNVGQIIIEEVGPNKQSRLSSYSFTKSCDDWLGCPGEIRATVNGTSYLVYRQYFTDRTGDSAYYSGWLYD